LNDITNLEQILKANEYVYFNVSMSGDTKDKPFGVIKVSKQNGMSW